MVGRRRQRDRPHREDAIDQMHEALLLRTEQVVLGAQMLALHVVLLCPRLARPQLLGRAVALSAAVRLGWSSRCTAACPGSA